jgi:hypothetical protein
MLFLFKDKYPDFSSNRHLSIFSTLVKSITEWETGSPPFKILLQNEMAAAESL